MRKIKYFFLKSIFLVALTTAAVSAHAQTLQITSKIYVDKQLETKVDKTTTSNQILAGTYTVSGILYVPTPPLPPIE